MQRTCPRCHQLNAAAARYCGRCGLAIDPELAGSTAPGRVRDPHALSPPEGFEAVREAENLYYRCEAAWGGRRLLETENAQVVVFNAGYALENVVLRVRGEDEEGRERFVVAKEVGELPRGAQRALEVASYEMPAPASRLTVVLASAEFGRAD